MNIHAVPQPKPRRPFTVRELISHDLKSAALNVWQRYTNRCGNYDHWRAARGYLWSAMVRPYWRWRTRHDYVTHPKNCRCWQCAPLKDQT